MKNAIKLSIRGILRSKLFSFLNIAGLATGMGCCLLIIIYVQHELSFDRHFKDSDKIYRVIDKGVLGNDFGAEIVAPAGPLLKEQLPDVESQVRFREAGNWVVKYQDRAFNETQITYADASVFDVFDIPLKHGNVAEALISRNTVIINQSMADKYFGTEDPVGKVMRFANTYDYLVTGVFEDIPDNTHFHFDFIVSLITRNREYRSQDWEDRRVFTYLKLSPNTSLDELEQKINGIVSEKTNSDIDKNTDRTTQESNNRYFLQPLTEVHLRSDNYGGFEPEGNIIYVKIFSIIAVFILVIACINFMNLSTARYSKKAKEVGIRKVLGSYRHQIIAQFIVESAVIALLAGVIGLIVAISALPYFNNFSGRHMTVEIFSFLPLVIAGSVIVGMISGLYPAFFLSAFTPIKILRGNLNIGRVRKGGLRKMLVTFQFFVSILLIMATFTVLNQLNFIQKKKLGFDKDQVLVVDNAFMLRRNRALFKDLMVGSPYIVSASYSNFLPTSSQRSESTFFMDTAEGQGNGVRLQNWRVDYDYPGVFGLQLVEGRSFSRDFATDSSAIIINQEAARQMGISNLNDPITGHIREGAAVDRYHIIGVVEDFHFESLKEHIEPLMMRLGTSTSLLSMKLSTDNYQRAIDLAADKWRELTSDQPFKYSFLDDRFNNMYEAETKLGDIFTIFAMLAIVIACLGLFGLAAFTAEQKTKEVGIRKVLGASLGQLIYLMSREVSILILISFVLATGLGVWGTNWWMQGFEYHPEINPMIFVAAGLGAFVIALLTMSYQSIKVAVANPVKALRNE